MKNEGRNIENCSKYLVIYNRGKHEIKLFWRGAPLLLSLTIRGQSSDVMILAVMNLILTNPVEALNFSGTSMQMLKLHS